MPKIIQAQNDRPEVIEFTVRMLRDFTVLLGGIDANSTTSASELTIASSLTPMSGGATAGEEDSKGVPAARRCGAKISEHPPHAENSAECTLPQATCRGDESKRSLIL